MEGCNCVTRFMGNPQYCTSGNGCSCGTGHCDELCQCYCGQSLTESKIPSSASPGAPGLK